jgi:lysozyme
MDKMIKVPPGPVTLNGLDISHYDGSIDFNKVRSSGRVFCIAKCTEYKPDSTFNRNRAGAKAAGLLFSGYHFFHPSRDPIAQAKLFLQTSHPEKGELRPMFDWESTDNIPSKLNRERGHAWLEYVEKQIGVPPIIYGGPYFLEALQLDPSFAKYPLCVSHYGTRAPKLPPPWHNWTFWQFTDKGDVPGIPAPDEDLDIFNGSMEDLKKLVL